MGTLLNITRVRIVCFSFILAIVSLLLFSCEDKNDSVKAVDLRYDVKDRYDIEAISPEMIRFVVKSSDTWEIYSQNPEWCSITPATGEPNEKSNVEVQYNDNKGLDDRIDTLIIKSDYWVGKWVTVFQKGIAFIDIDVTEITVSKSSDIGEFDIKSNQKWSVKVKNGESWLSIDSEPTGEQNGSVRFVTLENKGEKRYGTISILDRHGLEQAEVRVIQDGVQLDPALVEIRAGYNEKVINLPVISNAKWVAVKNDEEAEWYSFKQSESEGSNSLIILLDDNVSQDIRKSSFTLRTEAIEGVDPVLREVVVKQGFNSLPVRYYFDENERGKWLVDKGKPEYTAEGAAIFKSARITRDFMPAGIYTFNMKSMSDDAYSQIFFTYKGHEIRWHLNAATKKTASSTSPWTNHPSYSFDPTKQNKIILKLLDAGDGFMRVDWYLNDMLVYSLPSTKEILPNITWLAPSFVYLGSSTGTVVYDWYEYTKPVIWD